jgi:phosphatidylserine/phosphatidylglycerophosphate/cardiolipin synthase-like enzyme
MARKWPDLRGYGNGKGVYRSVDLKLLVNDDHYPTVIERVLEARRSVWIATANLKDLMVEDRRLVPGRARGRTRFRSVLAAMGELAGRGVELRILHASPPSRAFRKSFDRAATLVRGGLELRECPRNHLKLVIVDGEYVYFGSANWTGAGIGAKCEERRNFEIGLLSQDERLLDTTQELFERIWRGKECQDCKLRAECPMPLDERESTGARAEAAARATVRLKPAAKVEPRPRKPARVRAT